MSTEKSTKEESNQRVSDEELFAILRRANKEYGVPALVTSQINDIGGYDYSGTALNSRLRDLHEDGIIGHQKAANRHFWWLSSEGTTDPVEIPSLEALVDYDSLDSEKFEREKAIEIANENIPGFKKDWWQRVYQEGDNLFRVGGICLLFSVGLAVLDVSWVPSEILGGILIAGLGFVVGSLVEYVVGYCGHRISRVTRLPAEPWDGENLIPTIWNSLPSVQDR